TLGRQREALHQYEYGCQILAAELGTKPGADLESAIAAVRPPEPRHDKAKLRSTAETTRGPVSDLDHPIEVAEEPFVGATAAHPEMSAAMGGRMAPIRFVVLAGLGLAGLLALGAALGWRQAPAPQAPGMEAREGAASVSGVATTPDNPATVPTALAQRRSIVVLPFSSIGTESEYVASAITEDLTALLGRLPSTLVISQRSAIAYANSAPDVRQLRRELGVRFAVDGNVVRRGDQLRVHARLVDTESAAQLWAETLDERLIDVGDLSRMITLRIANTLETELIVAVAERSVTERPHNVDAVELTLRGRRLLSLVPSREIATESVRLCERAVALDPDFAASHACLAVAHNYLLTFRWSQNPEASHRAAEDHARRALALDPRNIEGHMARGVTLDVRQRFDEALAEFDYILALNPSNSNAHARRGWVKMLTGRPEEAIAHIEGAMRISPRDWNLAVWNLVIGRSNLMLNRDEQALQYFLRARTLNPNLSSAIIELAAVYVLTGRTNEGRVALAEFRQAEPQATISSLRRTWRGLSSNELFLAMRERMYDALGTIGMPDE
ncbi:MAG: tetratricopeptide repeat protein, partial [Rubritepida sp.]|nr:tetratricopeptide repeat protein [Rubritepida sp.]